jgi:hypothetical protein
MIIVRNSFKAKPGQASKLAAHFKEVAATANLRNPRVFTDVTGEFNTVVFVYDVESMAEWEESYKQYTSEPKAREKTQAYLDMWTSGRREFLRQV